MISTPIRRFAAFALPVGVCWCAWTMLIAPPLERIAADRDDIAQNREALRHYKRLESEIPQMQDRLLALKAQVDDGDYTPLASPALMAALMQDKVQRLVSTSAAVVRTSRTLQSAVENGFERVGMEIVVAVDAPDLKKVLWALSAAKPAIVVEHLSIQTPETEQPLDADVRPTFETVMTLSSFARSTSKAVGAAP